MIPAECKRDYGAPFPAPQVWDGEPDRTAAQRVGMEQSYLAIRKLLSVMGETGVKDLMSLKEQKNLPDEQTPVDYQAVREIIRLAREHTPEEPLYVVGNRSFDRYRICHSFLAPDITDKMVVVWLGSGHGKEWQSCSGFLMLFKNIAAAKSCICCGVAAVQLPCKMGYCQNFAFPE